MIEPSTWYSNSVFASFYLCDRQHALAGLRSLGPFLAAGGQIGLFSPLSTLVGRGGGGGWRENISSFQSIYIFYCSNCFYFLNRIVLYTVIVFPATSFRGTLADEWLAFSGSVPRSCYGTLSFAGLLPRQLVSCGIPDDRHSVAWPCLPRSWSPPALQLH